MKASPQKKQSLDDFERLKDLITQRYSSLSPQLQGIARFVLDHPDATALETVASLATKANVQPSSMVRFAQALDFSGFIDLQKVFQSRLVSPSSYRERINVLRHSAGNAAGPGAAKILASFVEEGISSLELLREDTSIKALDQAVKSLQRADHIYVIGERRAFPVAFYVYYSLLRLDLNAHLIDGVGGTLQQETDLAGRKDLLFGISFPPYSSSVAEAFERAKKRGVNTVAITDSAVSQLGLNADVALMVKQQETLAFRSLVAPMCLAQTLIVALGAKISPGTKS